MCVYIYTFPVNSTYCLGVKCYEPMSWVPTLYFPERAESVKRTRASEDHRSQHPAPSTQHPAPFPNSNAVCLA